MSWLPHPLNQVTRPPFAERVLLHDITLREGQQAPEIAFAITERVEIARLLGDVGVPYLQAGFAGRDDDTVRALKGETKSKISVLLVAFNPSWEQDLTGAVAAGADVVQVLVRSADRQLETMGITRDDVRTCARVALEAVREHGVEAWFIPSFATVADWDFVCALYQTAVDAGASAVFLADTLGIASPEALAWLVGDVRQRFDPSVHIGVHCHNDFGLGLATTLAGLAAGATIAEVSVNGYGERSGNCSLGELALALELLYGVDSGVDLGCLSPIERRTAALAGQTIPDDQPISGANVFAQKLDIHVALTDADAELLEPFPPETVGNERVLRLGRGTGPIAVNARLAQLGQQRLHESDARRVAHAIEELATRRKGSVSDEELLTLVAELAHERRDSK